MNNNEKAKALILLKEAEVKKDKAWKAYQKETDASRKELLKKDFLQKYNAYMALVGFALMFGIEGK